MTTHKITVCVAHIQPRAAELQRCLASIDEQTYPVRAVVVAIDIDHLGAAATKNEALSRVRTEWCLFVDDDDLLLPDCLDVLTAGQVESGADVVYGWPLMDGAPDPRPDRFGVPFDADELRRGSYLHTTFLGRTEQMRAVSGFQIPPGSQYDDWGIHLGLLDAGASFHHVPRQVFVWTVRGKNTSGRGDRW